MIKVIERVLKILNNTGTLDKDDILTGDKLENYIREIRFDAFDSPKPENKEKLLINAKDFDDA